MVTGAVLAFTLIVTQAVSVNTVRELAGRGDLEGARKVAEQLVQATPGNGEAWYLLGYVRAGLKDFAGAIEAYRSATRTNSGHSDAWNNLGDLLRRTGQVEEARDAIERGRRVNPKDPRLALNMALVQTQLRDFKKALAALDDLEALSGRSTLTDYLRARAYLEDGQVTPALPYLERFRSGEPQDPEAFLGLAKLLMSHDAAIQAADLLLGLKPEKHDTSTRFTLGQAFYAMDQMEKARDVFVELAAREPGKAPYLTWSGHAHRALGSIAQARSAYDKALQIDSSAVDALTGLAGLEVDAGNSDMAEVQVSRALALAPENPQTLFVAGQVNIRLQRWNTAIELLNKIKADAPEYAQAQYMLSRAFVQTGDNVRAEAAMAEFKKSSESSKRKPIPE